MPKLKTLTAFLFLFSFHLIAAEPQGQPPYTIISNEAKTPLLSPTFADRKVLKIRLSNGLEAYLISDPKADKSAAALSVKIGSWDDPQEHAGLAHFLEHMLFLGTKKYPQLTEYKRYITENGGATNAYTTSTYTIYMFSVENDAFDGALDRFSRFFYEPLFNPSGVSKELHAIDQEHAKNLDDDDRRTWMVMKELSTTGHPFHSFSSGNAESLSKTSQEALKEWYRQHYSSNVMSLIVYSSLPLDKLKEIVVADFQNVQNAQSKQTDALGQLLPDSLHGNMVYMEPIKDIRTLTILWEIPRKFSDMKESQPDLIACSLIGHEGEESLLAELKREDLAEALRCGSDKVGINTKALSIEIDLTQKGLKNVNTVIERLFQAIARFKEKETPAYLFDEIQKMQKINYEYQPRTDAFEYVMNQGDLMVGENLSTFPEHTLIIQKFDPKAVQQLLDILTPKNAFFFLMAPSTTTGVKTDRKEKWFNVPYTVKKINSEIFDTWEKATTYPSITFPAPNPFIPKNLSLVIKEALPQVNDSVLPHPEVIFNTPHGITYYAPDTRFNVPDAFVSFEIKTPHVDMGNPLNIVLADLYVDSISEALKRISYPASSAGLHYSISRQNYGINITVSGYSDNITLLFNEIVKILKDVHPTETQFAVYKDSLKRDYTNSAKRPSLEQAMEQMKKTLYRKFTTDKQKATAINKVTFKMFNEYAARLFSKIYVQGMVYGNITQDSATSLTETLINTLGSPPYPDGKNKKPEVIILPAKHGPFYFDTTTAGQGNTTVLSIEYPSFSAKIQASQDILMQAMKEEFFGTLRTKQQTGYLVFSYPRESERQLFNIFAVQSNSHAPRDLLARFELFIESFMQDFPAELSEERFEIIRKALINEFKEPAKDIIEMGSLLQNLALKYDADFNWIDKRIQAMKELTYAELIEFSRAALDKTNRRRFAVLMRGVTPQNGVLNFQQIPNINKLKKLSSFTD